MLVDDEYAIIGSANIGLRSMAYDSEISLGVIDAENKLVRDLRMALWAQHQEIDRIDSPLDPRDAVTQFYENAPLEVGRLRFFPNKVMSVRVPYGFIMNKIIDPYKGPMME